MHNPSQDEAYERQIRGIQNNITESLNKLKETQSKNNATSTKLHKNSYVIVYYILDAMDTAQPSKKEEALVQRVNTEFANLRKARLERSQQYKERYGELPTIRKERQKHIQARQQEFEKELEEKEARQKQKLTDNGMGACDKLIRQLQLVQEPVEQLKIKDHPDRRQQEQEGGDEGYSNDDDDSANDGKESNVTVTTVVERIQVVNAPYEDDDEDTSLLIVPLSIMELFWDINIQVPVRVSEIEPTLARIRERRDELSSL